jgi:predicted MFS family arabinose efflux permease
VTTSSPGLGRRPVLDRITWITYVQVSLFAFFLYGFGATQALLRDEQGTSRTVASLHATVFAVANVATGLLISRLIQRWGRGLVIRYAVIVMSIGIAVYTAPFGLTASLIGTALVACGGVSLIATANAFILDYQGSAGPAALTQANALAALFGFVVPLVIGITTAVALGWRTGLWALIIALVVAEIFRSRHEHTPSIERAETPNVTQPVRAEKIQMPRRFWWSLTVVALLLATEFTLTLWSADLLRERAGLGPAAAAASLAAVTGGMFLGRLYGSRLAQTWSVDRLLTSSILLALVAFAVAWVSTNPWPILASLFVVGLGISVHWPIGVSRAVASSGGLIDRASGLSSVAAGAAGGIAPFILGALSDSIGFHSAFLIVPVLLATALVLILAKPVKSNEPIVG